MKSLKIRVGALAAAGTLAAATVLGAVAMQDGDSGSNQRPANDAPIIYSGGFGLYPVSD